MRQQNSKLLIARIYAEHMVKTYDAITYTARIFDVSPTTVRKYISLLKDSPYTDDQELYEEVNKVVKSHKWGKTFVKA